MDISFIVLGLPLVIILWAAAIAFVIFMWRYLRG